MHGRKHFPGATMTTQCTKSEAHEQGKKTFVILGTGKLLTAFLAGV